METKWVEKMILRDLATLEAEVTAVTNEAQLWETPPGIVNSMGTLTLHLAGNLQHFIGAVLGKTGYRRDREREFAARGLSRAALLAEIAEAKQVVTSVLGSGNVDLAGDFPEVLGGKWRVTTGDFLVHLAVHLAFHLGQVGYLRRMLSGEKGSVAGIGIPSLATARAV